MSAARDADPATVSSWAVCGASVVGSEHVRRGLGCDDAYSFGVTDQFVVAAVADGAGSVTGTSAWGAYCACQSVLTNAMRTRFIRDFQRSSDAQAEAMMRGLFDRATAHAAAQAEAFGLDPALLATTLAVALSDGERAVFGQVGDGIIAVEVEAGVETLLVEPKDEYANTTWFLQSDKAFEESFRTEVRRGVVSFALSTDGMAYKITNVATGEPYAPFFTGSWQRVRDGATSASFASLLRGIEDDQTGDDKTVVLAALRPEDDEFFPSPRPVRKLTVSSSVPREPVVRADAVSAKPVAEQPTDAPSGPAPSPVPDRSPSGGAGPHIKRFPRREAVETASTDPVAVSDAGVRRRWGRRGQ